MRFLLSFFCLFSFFLFAEKDPVALYLTWQHDPSTTMTVQWITPLDEKTDQIFVQEKGKKDVFSFTAKETILPEGCPLKLHRVELTGLKPDQDYIFWVENQKKTHLFKTMPEKLHKPVQFVVGGDVYHDEIDLVKDMNKIVASLDPDFVILGGDLAYGGSKFVFFAQNSKRWIEFIKTFSETMVASDGRMIPIIAIVGNHDVSGRFDQLPARAPFYQILFPMTGEKGYQALDFGKYLSLILLDSGHTHPVFGEQREWLRDALEKRQTVLHKMAAYHVPAFPSVRKFYNKRSLLVRKYWVPLFEQYGLDAAFEHHDHAYKRTHPLFRGRRDSAGVLYFGDGAWGVKEPRKPASPQKVPYLAFTKSIQHVIFIQLEKDKKIFQAIDSQGNIFDTFEQKVSLYSHLPPTNVL